MATTKPQPDVQERSATEEYPFLAEYDATTIGEFVDNTVIASGIKGIREYSIPKGQKQWEVTNLFDPDNPERFATLTGIIVGEAYTRGLWPEEYDPNAKTGPRCYSDDNKIGWGEFGINPDTEEPSVYLDPVELRVHGREVYTDGGSRFGRCVVDAKHKCPMAEYGSGKGGKGTACRESIVLFIVLEGKATPIRIRMPITSVSMYRAYKREVENGGHTVNSIVTTFGLTKDNPTAPYSKMTFKATYPLTDDETATVTGYKAAIEGAFRPRNEDKVQRLLPVIQANARHLALEAAKSQAALPASGETASGDDTTAF